MDVKLILCKTSGEQKTIPLTRSSTIIGRGSECDLRIPIESCSRQQCELILEGEELTVRDLNSSNGTYVNNERVEHTTLHAGDRLTVGPIVLTIQINGRPADVQPAEPLITQPAESFDVGEELIPFSMTDDEVGGDVDALAAAAGGGIDEFEDDPIAALEALADITEDKKKKKH